MWVPKWRGSLVSGNGYNALGIHGSLDMSDDEDGTSFEVEIVHMRANSIGNILGGPTPIPSS